MNKRPINPFDYTSPVDNPSDYLGRAAMMSRMESMIQRRDRMFWLSVTGPRRMGTTSTLNVALHMCRSQKDRSVYIDLRTVERIDGDDVLVPRILSELHLEPVHGERWYDRIESPIPSFVLALDELDLVQGPNAHNFMSWLSMLPFKLQVSDLRLGRDSEHSSLIGILVGSRQSLFDIERSTECIDSPYYSWYTNMRLAPLSRKEAIEFVGRRSETYGLSLNREAPWIVRFAGTWPVFLKLGCHHVFEHKIISDKTNVTKAYRKHLEQQVMADAKPFLDDMWSWYSPRQRDLLSNLQTWQSFEDNWEFDPDVSGLVGQGVLKTTKHGLDYSCEMFGKYFKRKHYDETLVGHSLLTKDAALTSITKSLSSLGTCVAELASWDDSKEQNIQEIAYVILRSQYGSVLREAYTSNGPKRAYRCDLYVKDVDVVVEVKRVRNSGHASTLQSELNDDLVGYRQDNPDQRIVFLIWDKDRHISDREYFSLSYEKDRLLRLVFVP